jgi:hypothetical protein
MNNYYKSWHSAKLNAAFFSMTIESVRNVTIARTGMNIIVMSRGITSFAKIYSGGTAIEGFVPLLAYHKKLRSCFNFLMRAWVTFLVFSKSICSFIENCSINEKSSF